MSSVSSLKRFGIVLVLLAVGALLVWILFEQIIVAHVKPQESLAEAGRITIVVVFGLITIIFIRRSKFLISRHVGPHPASVFQFFMILTVGIMALFAILNIFQVSPTTLLVSGGVVSIVIGLVISTFVGNILAGTLVFMTNPFRVGDSVLVNNVPGKIMEITSMVTRVRSDIGGHIVIPNTAIVQGSVIVTRVPAHEAVGRDSRLPYCLGDRVYTTYMNGEGVVKELTPFYTKIMLDSGRELTFLNNSVLTGSAAIAKVSEDLDNTLRVSLKIDGDVENTIEAIKKVASSNPSTFKSAPTVLYSSLNSGTVELEISCTVDANKKNEAKSKLLETAYMSSIKKPYHRTKNGLQEKNERQQHTDAG